MIETLCQQAKKASSDIAALDDKIKTNIINKIASGLLESTDSILAANALDVENAKEKKRSQALIDRLLLTKERLVALSQATRAIAELPDPVDQTLESWTVPSGLTIAKVSIPLGVIAMIYESRPNVTIDASALCIKSGNAIILRGGSECVNTNRALVKVLHLALQAINVTPECIQFLPTQDRLAVSELLQMDGYIDVVIPRGGPGLIAHIREHSRITVFSHLSGLCHTYIHQDANNTMAIDVLINAKMRRTGICGATETLLIDKTIATTLLPTLVEKLTEQGCELRGDALSKAISPSIQTATKDDFSTEYLDAILSIKIVENIDEAIAHINQYGSNHTESIITESKDAATTFQHRINSAIVMHNCSTQFADGGEFGMGAEIGIATGKLHARGPVGVKQLTTFKYLVTGSGQTRA